MMRSKTEGVDVRRLYFVGVTTSGSSIMTIFPTWARTLGLDAEMHGVDLPLGAPPERVRAVLGELAADKRAAGALVTTHKAAVYDVAADLFAELDPWARLAREVSCVALRDGSLLGWAKDPITSRQAYTYLLGPDPWVRGDSDLVCLGVGGAGLALSVAILAGEHQPRRCVLADSDPARLAVARDTLEHLDVTSELELVVVDGPGDADRLVSSAAPGSFVVNATGMGKDSPGSPVSDAVVFPRGAIAWDMNYRGELRFLDIARAQEAERNLVVSDGWRYFLHGWTEVIAEVFQIPVDLATFITLAEIADKLSGRTPSGAPTAAGVSRG